MDSGSNSGLDSGSLPIPLSPLSIWGGFPQNTRLSPVSASVSQGCPTGGHEEQWVELLAGCGVTMTAFQASLGSLVARGHKAAIALWASWMAMDGLKGQGWCGAEGDR